MPFQSVNNGFFLKKVSNPLDFGQVTGQHRHAAGGGLPKQTLSLLAVNCPEIGYVQHHHEPNLMNDITKPDILIVEDSISLSETYREYLRPLNMAVTAVGNGTDALAVLAKAEPKIVLLDLRLPDMNGQDILHYITRRGMTAKVIIITAHGSIGTAVTAMQDGAADFLMKPFSAERLRATVQNMLEYLRLARMIEKLETAPPRTSYGAFVGKSLPMQTVYRTIDLAAPSGASVFITGESGTGKELCAEAIHQRSRRKNKPFIILNCAAIPKELIESEIFGHKKGAFTGASDDRDGAAVRADGGTLFLDEITEMDTNLQTKLLRFVQTGSFQPVGGDTARQADIRFICATNRNPQREVEEGRFREDLYYRLHVIAIGLPPLRERDDDIVEIANHFLARFSTLEGKTFRNFSQSAINKMLAYRWPGNVRQLQNIIHSAVVLHDGEIMTDSMLPQDFDRSYVLSSDAAAIRERDVKPKNSATPAMDTEILPLRLAEKQIIQVAIEACGGNIPQAAAKLEVSPSTLYRKLQSW